MTFVSTPQSKKTIDALWRLEKIILDSLDFNEVVQKICDSVLLELGYLELGYEIVVLTLVDEPNKVLQRVAISKTQKAVDALAQSPVPFQNIDIPLTYQQNILIKAIYQKEPQVTTSWADVLVPALTKENCEQIQRLVGIEASLVYPVMSRAEAIGAIIFSMSKPLDKITEDERDLIKSFSDVVGLAVQNASLYSQLKTAKEAELAKAQELLKLKDQFVFIATHELKNPVTAMKGFLSMFDEGTFGQIPEKMQDPLKQIEIANQQLVNLVNDLLEIARSEAKTITLMPQTVNVCETTDTVIKSVHPLADQKSLTLAHPCKGTPCKATADPNRLLEIINNLVSNAIKYSQAGTITVSHEEKDGKIITHVSDQGIGISPEHQSKIFTQFFRAEEEAAKGIPGTGLGLFIVKQLVEKMGGQIWFTSELNKGSSFSFSLPKATSGAA